ncbi:protein EMSY-LIKE 1-like isoform X1 [Prosopis cineraria]|uniref:protein EMSY-LIKE 1-like isoform X1 n=1 Tax=Prosopis cineraria TaxID=364024 RepID=UPI00240EC5F7|nr:protein EMSY-LIKE 1-like isoform X1 [Prosopis cineraria]XP_054784872.1 protein EMSY-LIKE 1-like isoform X1 [Prosopis cineraria]XP_054784880.1 protein EMSY-LIKE 1-like isoform X1 [Prosopis cineraria]
MYIDMEDQIHLLEQEAYSSVLRAFKAQSDALSWEKEGLITELRKELRVSDDEHRELLTRVNADEIIHRIREWRQTGSYQPSIRSSSQPLQDVLPSPTVSASRKKQKTSQWVQSLPGLSSVKSVQYPAGAAGGRHLASRSSFNARPSNAPAEAAASDPLIGKKVWTRWPEDNHFYEGVITDYNPAEYFQGRHALVYDINTPSETWEWVDLKEISPEDIRWDEDPGILHRGGPIGQGHGVRKSFSRSVDTRGTGRGRGHPKAQPRREFHPPQNGIVKRVLDEFELLSTDLLVKEVERVFAVSQPDPMELEKAKNMLKEHEQALVDAIARLADASDGESDGEHPPLDGQLMETG